jgi:glucose/mannose transport system substrate-binding protein
MKKLISILFSLMLPLSFTSASKAGGHMEAEVIHWWTSGGEQAAITKFAEAWEGMGGTWIDTAITGGENARGLEGTLLQLRSLTYQNNLLI